MHALLIPWFKLEPLSIEVRADEASGGDIRYAGLTPAQYLSLGVTLIGCVLWMRLLNVQRASAQAS